MPMNRKNVLKDNEVIRRILMKAGPLPRRELYLRVQEEGYYCCGGGYFYDRLNRMVKRGALVALLVRGTNHYVHPDALGVVRGADLTDPAERKMAADVLEEEGADRAAALLRKAKRCKGGK